MNKVLLRVFLYLVFVNKFNMLFATRVAVDIPRSRLTTNDTRGWLLGSHGLWLF